MERHSSGTRVANKPPIRTYSKRATSTGSTEPPLKRRRTNSVDVNIHSIAGRFAQSSEVANESKDSTQVQLSPALPVQQPKKGTILSYFKVRSPSSETLSPCAQSSEPTIPSSTPPSSPPAIEPSRKQRRRLTTKPALRTETSTERDGDEGAMRQHGLSDVSKEGLEGTQSVLMDTATSFLDIKRHRDANRSMVGKREATKKQKSKQSSVQTTLSLSLTEKQFVECTGCNMIYNPYHEKDVKMHKKRHSALLGSKKTAVNS